MYKIDERGPTILRDGNTTTILQNGFRAEIAYHDVSNTWDCTLFCEGDREFWVPFTTRESAESFGTLYVQH